MKVKLLFASVDIGWRVALYRKFLITKKGFNRIESFVKYKVPSKQYQTNYDYQFQFSRYPAFIQWIISFAFFIYALFRFNTFYFFSGETILTRRLRILEFQIYKLLRKKIIMHFVGSDIRNPNHLKWLNQNVDRLSTKMKKYAQPLDWQAKLISDSQKYADHILVSTPDLLQIIPSAEYYPVLIDANHFQNECKKAAISSRSNFFKTDKIKVLHAPSNVQLKGSDAIDRVLKNILKTNDHIEYLNTKHLNRETGTVYTVSRYELFQLYQEADIVIDQMVIGWYGLQSIEALLSNCLVICYIDEDLKKYLYPNCPILSANINELESKLLNAIKQLLKNQNVFISQEKWVLNFHTIKYNNTQLISSLKK
jgi:hypothetical protein